MAVEAEELALEEKKEADEAEKASGLDGVLIKERSENGIKISYVEITAAGEEAIGKKAGKYLILEVQGIRQQDTELQRKGGRVFAGEFSFFKKRRDRRRRFMHGG